MTPAARVAAAIEILDQIGAGAPAEAALLRWARAHRFAGSKDRAAIRDHVFDAVRRRRSAAARGGGETGRCLMIGLLREAGARLEDTFGAEGYAPDALTKVEKAAGHEPTEADARDLPDWLLPRLVQSLGAELDQVAAALRQRAPTFIRAASHRLDRSTLRTRLLEEGVEAVPATAAETALRIVSGARRLRQTAAFQHGLFELQDAASQAVCAALPLPEAGPVWGLCAGGGGKALALAARGARVLASDTDPKRMSDIPTRAARAGTPIPVLPAAEVAHRAPFPLIVVDAPCSGSGTWARSPDAKWRLTEAQLNRLIRTQSDLLDQAAALTSPQGHLAYITCSILEEENRSQCERFLARQTGWRIAQEQHWRPSEHGDGFYLVVFRRGD